MKRNSLEAEYERWPALKHVLHECRMCHAIGLKPGILATFRGDYGLRQAIQGRFEELRLGADGLCDRCADEVSSAVDSNEKV